MIRGSHCSIAKIRLLALWISISSSAGSASLAEPLQYPESKRTGQVDVYHGVRVADPFRWLESDIRTSAEVANWVEKQNRVAQAYLQCIPERAAVRRRLTDLWNFPQYSSPMKRGGRYYYLKNDGLQNQSVLYVMDSLDGQPQPLLDPNTWSRDGTLALAGLGFSDDGRYVAYGQAEAGSDWTVWRVMEIASRKPLPDELRWIKFSGAEWTKDGRGFFYCRFPKPESGEEFQALNFDNKVYYHRLGTPQSADVMVFWRPENRDWHYDAVVSDDGQYLVISASRGTDERQRIFVRDLHEPFAAALEVVSNFENEYTFVGNDGAVLYLKTDLHAPRGRVIAIDLHNPAPGKWREVIPQAEATLTQTNLVGNHFIATYLKDVVCQAKIFSLEGKFVHEVSLPGIGTATGFSGKRTDSETFYTFSSIATPPSLYRLDVASGASHLLRRSEAKFNPDHFQVEQVFYQSKDGTRVPMFIAYKKGIARDGANPTLLYGYGGFNISMLPTFSISRVAWMEMGGVYAQPNLRGGGEYGEAWHRGGTKLQKQNVFDDFIAAAEWLIAQKFTRPEKLAVQGGSNGGLLVGAVETQRPDLFGACLPAVGVMDMLRFHKFTEGRLWVDDYGSAENSDEFKALYAYSPLHNIKPGAHYPATLITTADTDDRVVPGHSFKFAAALQAAQSGPAPILIRVASRAGHGAGKPVSKRIDETTDEWAFLVKSLGITLPAGF